jgi:hypothetical protein
MPSQSDRDARIRDRAYQIWDREGRRHGQDEAHWQQAKREIEAEEATAAAGRKAPGRSTRARKAPVASEANPPSVSRARAKDEAAAKSRRTRAAVAARADTPAATARPKAAPARATKTTT